MGLEAIHLIRDVGSIVYEELLQLNTMLKMGVMPLKASLQGRYTDEPMG